MNGAATNSRESGGNEVSSLWEQFQLNNDKMLNGDISALNNLNMKQQCSDLIIFVNGK